MIKVVLKLFAWFEKNYILSLLIAILIASFIFYLSSESFADAPAGGFGIKTKVYHVLIFFALAFFMILSFVQGKNNSLTLTLILAGIIIATVYACSDELHQFFVKGRHCTIRDVLYDFTGIIFAGMIYGIRLNVMNGKKK